jgi:hypothetical protein
MEESNGNLATRHAMAASAISSTETETGEEECKDQPQGRNAEKEAREHSRRTSDLAGVAAQRTPVDIRPSLLRARSFLAAVHRHRCTCRPVLYSVLCRDR